MGFDNECIVNIQSLPGEYFCPVCRTLVYPNEAMQAACTHLYCKPCLTYIVSTTSACPYDGYLVSEKDAKPLVESGKPIADAIGNIQVHCLFHRSGCQWQGTLAECITHCANCTFGNSPVVCNRCGTQIVHRQVQEHAQTCPGVQPQGQQSGQHQSGVQSVPPASHKPYSQPTVTTASGSASAAPVVDSSVTTMATTAPVQGHPTASQQQAAAQTLTQEQWSQQYQQYYQQYPGLDPYQQQYQQYGYHHQPAQTYGQSHSAQGQPHSQAYAQQYPQTMPQLQAQQQYPPMQGQQQAQAYPQTHPQAQIHSQSQTVPFRPQTHVVGQPTGQQSQNPQLHAHAVPHAQLPHMQHPARPIQMMPQSQQQPSHAQYQPHPSFPGQALTPTPNQQVHEQSRAYPRSHSASLPPIQPHMQSQSLRPSHSLNQPLPEGQNQLVSQSQAHHQSAPAQSVTGYQSFPQPHLQPQMPVAGVSQHPMQIHPAQHGPVHSQQQQHHQIWPQPQARHASPIPQTHIQVQRPANVQVSQHHVTSNNQPQISSFHHQVQHTGSFPQNLHYQGQHPQPQLQPTSQLATQSTVENHILSHQHSKMAPDDVAVQLHGLPSESESAKAPVPSTSPSNLKLPKEEADSGAGFPNSDLPSQNSDVMHDGLSIQKADSNNDGKKEDKMDEQTEQDYRDEHKDGDVNDKSVHLEETDSKTDGDNRPSGHGPGHTMNSGGIQLDDSRSSSQASPYQMKSSGDSINILPPTEVQPNPESMGPPHQPNPITQNQERHTQLASHVPLYLKDASSQMPHMQQLTSNQGRPSLSLIGNNASPEFHGHNPPFASGPPSSVPPVVPQLQSHVPTLPPYDASVLPISSHAEPFSGAPIPGQPGGPHGPVISMNAAMPFTHTEGQQFRSLHPGPYDGARVGHIHSTAPDSFASGNQAGEMSKMTNGFLGHSGSYMPHALGNERIMLDENQKMMAAEGLGPPEDPHFMSFRDPPRRVIDRRKLEEDLKEFPRPSELDSQAGAKFGTPSAASFGRSFDRGIAGFRPEGPSGVRVHSPVSTRSMPFYMHGSHISSDGSLSHQMENADWHRLPRSASEFDNRRLDSGHLSRSPGSEFSGLASNRFGTGSLEHRFGGPGRAESFGPDSSGILPNHVRIGNGIIPGVRGGGSTGFDVMPWNVLSDDRFGAVPGNFNDHLHFDDYPLRDFSSHNDSFQSGYGSLDNSRKRKESSIGWCLICDIYCETDEGRNLHYQTMEHQNRTMDIVLSIKQRYSKKLLLSSEEHESSKFQKVDVGGYPNRR